MKRKKVTAGAFGNWPTKLGEVLAESFAPPVSVGDEVAIKTLLGEAITGEVIEASPAGITLLEDGGPEHETFVAAGSIDSMKVYRYDDGLSAEEEDTEPGDEPADETEEAPEAPPAPEPEPENG